MLKFLLNDLKHAKESVVKRLLSTHCFSFKFMVFGVGNYDRLLSAYAAFAITKFFRRQSHCLFSAGWGSFLQTSFLVADLLPIPSVSPEAKIGLRVSCTFVSSVSVTKATSWLVLSLLGPPGYNRRLFLCTSCHWACQNRPLREDAVDGPADLLLDVCSVGNPLQTAQLTQCLWQCVNLSTACTSEIMFMTSNIIWEDILP